MPEEAVALAETVTVAGCRYFALLAGALRDTVGAAEAGADYVAFGAFFATETKAPAHWAELEIVDIWSEISTTPCFAIGGITVENAEPLVRAGADFLAVSAGVWRHPEGEREAVRQFNALFDRLSVPGN